MPTEQISADQTRRRRPMRRGHLEIRRATAQDTTALVAMHERCSAETLSRRYQVPPRIDVRFAQSLIEPESGWTLLASYHGAVHGIATLAVDAAGENTAGVLVEDRWQRHGLGARLLRTLARQAADDGSESLTLNLHSDNPAMLTCIRRTGMTAMIAGLDGVTQATVPIGHLRSATERRDNKLEMGEVTTPLVTLLHERRDLRGVSGLADLIDEAVRSGV